MGLKVTAELLLLCLYSSLPFAGPVDLLIQRINDAAVEESFKMSRLLL